MTTSNQVAIITGGASGIGLAVAEALAARGAWIVHILDRNKTDDSIELKASFHPVDVTDYSSLASAFSAIFSTHKRLDFVFANAGIALEPDISTENRPDTSGKPPPAPGTLLLDTNLRSVSHTTHLAGHYFKLCAPVSSVRSVVITASSAGFYASPISPMYAASKHGVVGWTRSIAPSMWKEAGVRVNAICPGIVRTKILPDEMFQMFPESFLTSIDIVVEAVLMLMDGNDTETGSNEAFVGKTVEVSGTKHYFRKQIEYCDAPMAAVMGATET